MLDYHGVIQFDSTQQEKVSNHYHQNEESLSLACWSEEKSYSFLVLQGVNVSPGYITWLFDAKSSDDHWYNDQFLELKRLGTLQNGWDSYNAEAPTEKAFYWTRETLNIMHSNGFFDGKVVPSAEGGLAITFRRGEKYSDIEFLNSGEILAVTHETGQRPNVWTVPCDEDGIQKTLENISYFLNK
jgi:hypothetical protein